MAISTRQGFIEYCLRQLGYPVIEINVAEEQISDRIDDAIQYFWEFHGDGLEKHYISKLLTEQDIINKYISIPDNVITVIRVFPFNFNNSSLNIDYQSFLTDVMNLNNIQDNRLKEYVIASQYINTINELFNYEKSIRWNRYTNQLRIDTDWSKFEVGSYIIIEAFVIIDPSDYDEAWNSPWLKSYATSLIKRQWGQNMIKYGGFQLPSGMILNGRQLFDDANNEILKLEEELRDTWSLPPDFMMG